MKHLNGIRALGATLGLVLTAGFARGQFTSGSDGSYGPIDITVDTELEVPPDGIFNATTITLSNASPTLTFKRNARNTPVYLLATGDVTINASSVISVAGKAGTFTAGGVAGPGGYDGGAPPTQGAAAGAGRGPGAGKAGQDFTVNDDTTVGGGAYGGLPPLSHPRNGQVYGSPLLIPLMGGSGGGGTTGPNTLKGGGGGGGAILIASSTRITFTGSGSIAATSSSGGGNAAGGSGGAIRLLAPVVENLSGNATLDVNVGFSSGGSGRVRIDTLDRSHVAFGGNIPPASLSIGSFMVVFPPVPRLDIVTAAGTAIALDSGPVSVLLPFGSPAAQDIVIRGINFPAITTVDVVLTPDAGDPVKFTAQIPAGTSPSQVTVPVTFPVDVRTFVDVFSR